MSSWLTVPRGLHQLVRGLPGLLHGHARAHLPLHRLLDRLGPGIPPLFRRHAGYLRPLLGLGSLLQVAGLFCAAQATRYWQLLLAQGLCMGLGSGLLFVPTLAVVSTYFRRRKSLAIGIGMAGSSTGRLVFPSMVRQLLPRAGLPWTLRAIGFVQLGSLLAVVALMRPLLPPTRGARLIDQSALRDHVYVLYAASMFLDFLGVCFAFYYLASFARSDVIGLSNDASLDLLLVLNGVGLLGRVLPSYVADRWTGPINVLLPMAAASGLLCVCWIGVRGAGPLYAWTCVYAVTANAVQSMSPAAISSLTTDLRLVGVRVGMVFSIVSFAVLAGPPAGGGHYQFAGREVLGRADFFPRRSVFRERPPGRLAGAQIA